MILLAIDPGPEQSAGVVLDNGTPQEAWMFDNAVFRYSHLIANTVVIEWIENYGMPAGKSLFDTARWIGRFQEQAEHGGANVILIPRREVKIHLCGSMRANDATIRQALIDRFGGSREKAIGTKKAQGPLYGIKTHCWAALALAVTYSDRERAPSD